MCKRLFVQVAPIWESEVEEVVAGHILTTEMHRDRLLRSHKVVGRSEHGDVIRQTSKGMKRI